MSYWIKTNDRLPRINGYYFVYSEDEGVIICSYNTASGIFYDDQTAEGKEITHWAAIQYPDKPE